MLTTTALYARISLLLLLLMPAALHAAQQSRVIMVGTAGISGVYFPLGSAICKLLNRNRAEHGILCQVEATGGSIDNLRSIRVGELDIAGAQSDWQHYSYHGLDLFAARGPDRDLRSIFSVHAEPFTILARADSDIHTFDDLRGKRVDIGNPGSGQQGTIGVFLRSRGWSDVDFARISQRAAADQANALCDNLIDAMVYMVGHPDSAIKDATTACATRFVAVEPEDIDRLLRQHAYYRQATIPGDMYPGNHADTPTFGVGATFVASSLVPEDTVYELVKAVFENFEQFRQSHPALKDLQPEQMVHDGLSAPLHRGAVRYFREAGLL